MTPSKKAYFSLLLLPLALGALRTPARADSPTDGAYEPRGVGGGGAMAAYSISPYSPLRFVGTDMGTLFRSPDGGRSWIPISHAQITMSTDLAHAGSVGFSADTKTVFYATSGRKPKRSLDGGETWKATPVPLAKDERIRYWASDRSDPDFLLCATDQGIYRTRDRGEHWRKVASVAGPSAGTLILRDGPEGQERLVFHATEREILLSRDGGATFAPWFKPPGAGLRAFAGGADAAGLTLAFIDTDGDHACAWAGGGDESKKATRADCGFVWIHHGPVSAKPAFARSAKEGGHYIRMAENDSQTIYVTGGNWFHQYGSKVWVSTDQGRSWELRFHVYDWDKHPYRPWPADQLEYSAIGLDVGWYDNAYFSFAVNPADSAEAGGTGHYFLHVTRDQGRHWTAPFTKFRDTGERTKGKRWSSTGLEVTSVLKLKFHPKVPALGYAGLSDLGGYVTEDGGETWRISRTEFNTLYDFAFDPAEKDEVFAAAGDLHDYPLGYNGVTEAAGGIYRSDDRGRRWERLTPSGKPWNRQFLSVAYDPIHKTLYGGTQGAGIARSRDRGRHWEYFNPGLPEGGQIIPQLEIDPANGNAYALVAGDAPRFTNQAATGIYFLDVAAGSARWNLLRGNLRPPHGVDPKHKLWWYPSSFAVDFSWPTRNVLWLTDMENKGAWLATGIWKSFDRGQTWERLAQSTHPTSIVIDPEKPSTVYAAGSWAVDGSWGDGGALYTVDGGATWKKNRDLPFLSNLYGIRPDPSRPENLFYLFFGSGMLYGPKPR